MMCWYYTSIMCHTATLPPSNHIELFAYDLHARDIQCSQCIMVGRHYHPSALLQALQPSLFPVPSWPLLGLPKACTLPSPPGMALHCDCHPMETPTAWRGNPGTCMGIRCNDIVVAITASIGQAQPAMLVQTLVLEPHRHCPHKQAPCGSRPTVSRDNKTTAVGWHHPCHHPEGRLCILLEQLGACVCRQGSASPEQHAHPPMVAMHAITNTHCKSRVPINQLLLAPADACHMHPAGVPSADRRRGAGSPSGAGGSWWSQNQPTF